jgi:signal transduction histidine kinase/DNA-binding NarL/FixJ family response regulator
MALTEMRVLLVGEDAGDARLVEVVLAESGLPVSRLERAADLAEATVLLARGDLDVALLVLRLADSSGLATLNAVRASAPAIPLVVVTSLDDDTFALNALRGGADECVPRDEMDGRMLGRAVRHAVERRQRGQWSDFMHRALTALTSTLDFRGTLKSLAHLAVPALGDWCVIELVEEDGSVGVAEVVAADPARARALTARLRSSRSGPPEGEHPVDEVLRTGKPRLCEVVDAECRQRIGYDDDHRRLLVELGASSMVVVPLVADDRVLGAISLTAADSGRRYGPGDVVQLQELARQAAVAIANAERFRHSQDARDRAEEEAARAAHLERVAADLGEALLPAEVGAVALRHGMEAVAAVAGLLLVPDASGTSFTLLESRGVPESALATWSTLGPDESLPLTEDAKLEQPVFVSGREEVLRRLPQLEPVLAASGCSALLSLPLVAHRRIAGVLLLLAPEPFTQVGPEREFLAHCAGHCAFALERAVLYQREQQAKQEARSAARAHEEVLAIVAHDLRNPLSAISIYASMIEDGSVPGDMEKAGASIGQAARQMDRLIQDLLDSARLEAGKLELTLSELSAVRLLEDAALMVRPLAERKGLSLRAEVEEGLPPVLGDADRIQQVLSNLLANALSATDAGEITLRAAALDDEVIFLVSDTGRGISAGNQPRLFDRFWRADRRGSRGTGLGLPIAKNLVELHGGRIGVESEPGEGTTVFFTLPLASARASAELEGISAASAAAPVGGSPDAPRRPVRVFLVDDHPAVLRGLKDYLKRAAGCEVVGEAVSGEEAVRRLPHLEVDVVLMDIGLPGMSGLEAMREITRMDRDVAVLALTAESDEDTLLPVLEAGGRGFVAKTRVHEDLLRAIEAAVLGEVFLHPSGSKLLLREFRSTRAGHADPRLEMLVDSERRVVALSAEGFTSHEIGKKLFISPKTVDSYRSRAMRKLGLRGRAEMVHFAVETGLLQS